MEAAFSHFIGGFGLRQPLLLAQEVQADGGGNAVQPAFQRTIAPVAADGPPGLEHGLLHTVSGVLLVVGVVPAHPPDHLLMGRDQLLKGSRVALLRPPQGEFVGHISTSLSQRGKVLSTIQTMDGPDLFPGISNYSMNL